MHYWEGSSSHHPFLSWFDRFQTFLQAISQMDKWNKYHVRLHENEIYHFKSPSANVLVL